MKYYSIIRIIFLRILFFYLRIAFYHCIQKYHTLIKECIEVTHKEERLFLLPEFPDKFSRCGSVG